MKQANNYIFKSSVIIIITTLLFSCQSDLATIQKFNTTEKFPTGVAKDFKLTYTDSPKVKAILTSPVNNDFSNQDFPYSEFPNGLTVDFFDKQKNKSTVTADYGILYSETNLIDLQGNVNLQTYDGKQLKTPQLYWDQKNKWIFTEKTYTFTSPDLNMSGTGIDFDKEFNVVYSHKNSGEVFYDEKP